MRAGSSLPDHYACIHGGRSGGGSGEDDGVFDGKFATTWYQKNGHMEISYVREEILLKLSFHKAFTFQRP